MGGDPRVDHPRHLRLARVCAFLYDLAGHPGSLANAWVNAGLDGQLVRSCTTGSVVLRLMADALQNNLDDLDAVMAETGDVMRECLNQIVTGEEFQRRWYAGEVADDLRDEVRAVDALMRTGYWN